MFDQSEQYEFYKLSNSCDSNVWIIKDINDSIRVWASASEQLFVGKESEYAFDKTDKGYLQVEYK